MTQETGTRAGTSMAPRFKWQDFIVNKFEPDDKSILFQLYTR